MKIASLASLVLLLVISLGSCVLFYPEIHFYVSSDGNDLGLGTQNSPWKTFGKVMGHAGAGDTVHLLPGVFSERLVITISGEAGNPVTFRGELGSIIDGEANPDNIDPEDTGNGLIVMDGVHHVVVAGLELKNSANEGVVALNGCTNIDIVENTISDTDRAGIAILDSSFINIEKNSIKNAAAGAVDSGMRLANVGDFTISGNTIDTVGDTAVNRENGITIEGACNNGDISDNQILNAAASAIMVSSMGEDVTNLSITKNTSTDSYYGIFLNEAGGSLTDILVYNNTVRNCENVGIVINTWSESDSTHIYERLNINANTVVGTRNGMQIAALKGSTMTDIKINNNLLVNAGRFGMIVSGPNDAADAAIANSFYIINNTIYNSGIGDTVGGGMKLAGHFGSSSSFVFRNNIVAESTFSSLILEDSVKGTVTIDFNLFTDNYGLSGETHGLNAIDVADPGFSNAGSLDFSLTSSSPARNAGSNTLAPSADIAGTSRPLGTAVDIGAFEFIE